MRGVLTLRQALAPGTLVPAWEALLEGCVHVSP